MKAFQIECIGGYSQNHIVIANDYATAEKLWKKEYQSTPIAIKKISDYVIVQEVIND